MMAGKEPKAALGKTARKSKDGIWKYKLTFDNSPLAYAQSPWRSRDGAEQSRYSQRVTHLERLTLHLPPVAWELGAKYYLTPMPSIKEAVRSRPDHNRRQFQVAAAHFGSCREFW